MNASEGGFRNLAEAWLSARAAAGFEGDVATAALIVLGGMSAMLLFNLATAPRAERLDVFAGSAGPDGAARRRQAVPRVSFLVPARNEAENLPVLVAHLETLDYDDLEIILLDDSSEDSTWEVLEDAVARLHRPEAGVTARAVRGEPLPPDWLGKNRACHRLAGLATGDVFVFCDADARPGPQAVRRTVAALERYRAGCATFMPRQILGSWSERAVIPVLLHVSLLCFLPLALVPRFGWRRLGVANGQWLAFTRATYDAIGGHAAVRNHVVEDIGLARRVQEHRRGLVVLLAARTLEVRMYRDFRDVWDGFGKNLFFLIGDALWRAPFFGAFFLLVHLLPWLLWPRNPLLWTPPLVLLLACRVIVARILREPLTGIPLQAAGALLVPVIAARSLVNHHRGRLVWKGRRLVAAPPRSKESP